jgi:FHA domain
MTSSAPPISSEPAEASADPVDEAKVEAPAADQKTAPLGASPTAQPILDSLSLLDHRTRGRAIPRHLAPFGHYLAFSEDGAEWLVPIDARVTHIGRGLTADVRLEEQRVSRTHAILVRHGHHTRLLDNRSANGTFVNGRRILATNITDGDVVRLGPVVMTYLQVA